MKQRKDYAKRSENVYRNQMIVDMWHDTNKSLKQIADIFNVSYGTVLNAVHKHVEYNQGTYQVLVEANQYYKECQYSQAVITRAWLALYRWYPEAAADPQSLARLTIGADVDNNVYLSAAVEYLIVHAIDYLRECVAL